MRKATLMRVDETGSWNILCPDGNREVASGASCWCCSLYWVGAGSRTSKGQVLNLRSLLESREIVCGHKICC